MQFDQVSYIASPLVSRRLGQRVQLAQYRWVNGGLDEACFSSGHWCIPLHKHALKSIIFWIGIFLALSGFPQLGPVAVDVRYVVPRPHAEVYDFEVRFSGLFVDFG